MQLNKKIVLFDIDYTLFDIERFRRKIFGETISAIGYKGADNIEKKLQDLYIASRRVTGYFNPKLFIKELINEFNIKISTSALTKSIFRDSVFRGNLYKEAKEALEILSRMKLLKVGIFSGGNTDFQIRKIREVKHLLHKEHMNIFIFKEKELPSVVKKYRKYRLYIIDDILNILRVAKTLNKNVFTIWIKRPKRIELQKPIPDFSADATITNLKEVVELVQNDY